MSIWRKIRIGLFIFSFVSGLLSTIYKTSDQVVELGWSEISLVFCFMLIALPLLIGIQSKAPYMHKKWVPPTLDTNFFTFGDPLHFFHLAVIVFLIGGVAAMIGTLYHGNFYIMEGVMEVSIGLGALLGVKICAKICSFKY